MGLFSRKKNERATAEVDRGAKAPSETTTVLPHRPSSSRQYVELGSIDYVNLTRDGKHGDYDTAIATAKATGKPIFANFVEWSG
jgi:hypothetical protein